MAGRRVNNGATLGFEQTLWQEFHGTSDALLRAGVEREYEYMIIGLSVKPRPLTRTVKRVERKEKAQKQGPTSIFPCNKMAYDSV